MKQNDVVIDALGCVIPQKSPCAFVSLKEYDCYALVSSFGNKEIYERNPVHVVYESILWGSKMLKSHPLYWADKRKLLTRILRSANTALFQQCKEHIESNAVDAMVGFRGVAQLWLAVVGQVNVWRFDGVVKRIYPSEGVNFIAPLGSQRYSFAPHIVSIPFESQGMTIVTSGSVSGYLERNISTFSSVEQVISAFSSVESPGAWIIIPHEMR